MSREFGNLSAVKIKNKNPSALQITAEQILREAKDRQDKPVPIPTQRIADKEELDAYQLLKRKGFEDAVRRNRTAVGAWLKYATWETTQGALDRARSVYERALDFEPRNQTIWLKYSEMEMKNKNVNRARNVLDRVVMILPRVDLFWYKYTYMEELVDNVAGARQVFERWMEWEPTEEAWMAYVKFEQSREIFKKFVTAYPQPKNWLKWAKFEEANTNIDISREIYNSCMQTLGEEYIDQNVYISFAKFETRQKQIERSRVIYKYALEKLPEGQKENLYNVYTQFEKQYGGREGIEDVVISKRRELLANPHSYDTWFDYIRLEETHGRQDKVRAIYERAIAQVPLITEKRHWRRYMYLWIYYAIWEETETLNMARTKQIYASMIKVIPHSHFTFAKVWNLHANFLIRYGDLNLARKTLGLAIGTCEKEKIYKNYIDLELSLREFDRVRTLYEKYLAWMPSNCQAWIRFAELERSLGDIDRARAIFDIAAEQSELDMPEVLWKSYIDFEAEEQEWDKARQLYHRLLKPNFEYGALDSESESERIQNAIQVFKTTLNLPILTKPDKLTLLESYLLFVNEHSPVDSESVLKLMPKLVKKRRVIAGGYEEYVDPVFPDEEVGVNTKLLSMAHEWKLKMALAVNEDEEEDDDDDE